LIVDASGVSREAACAEMRLFELAELANLQWFEMPLLRQPEASGEFGTKPALMPANSITRAE
jgi:hypothetical protein